MSEPGATIGEQAQFAVLQHVDDDGQAGQEQREQAKLAQAQVALRGGGEREAIKQALTAVALIANARARAELEELERRGGPRR